MYDVNINLCDLIIFCLYAGSRKEIIDILEGAGYKRFDHRNDYHNQTQANQNDLFVRHDIVKKYNVVQL
jgi:hypothetical protein